MTTRSARRPLPDLSKPTSLAGSQSGNRYWGEQEPPKDRAEIFSATTSDGETGTSGAAAAGTVATLRLYGPIDSWGGYWGVSAKDVASALDALGPGVTEIRLRINSPGGECWEGLAILNMLRAHAAKVVAVVDGVAASAASFIAAGCDETVMSPGTQMMIHDAWASAWGCNAQEMRKVADFLDTVSQACAELYAEAAGGTVEAWRAAMVEETWYTASEAVSAGLADRVGVVQDAGTASTAGEEEPDLCGCGEDDCCAAEVFDLSIYTYAGRKNAPAPAAARRSPKPPTASADGPTTTQEGTSAVDFTDEQITTMRQELGLPEDADEATIVAALSEALAEQAEDTAKSKTTTPPEGMVLVEKDVWEATIDQAKQGADARQQQLTEHRDRTIKQAILDGKITPARQKAWEKKWAADAEGTEQELNSLEAGLVPVDELGHAQDGETSSAAVKDNPKYQNWRF